MPGTLRPVGIVMNNGGLVESFDVEVDESGEPRYIPVRWRDGLGDNARDCYVTAGQARAFAELMGMVSRCPESSPPPDGAEPLAPPNPDPDFPVYRPR